MFEHLIKQPKPKHKQPRAIVFAPTRELALQIYQDGLFLAEVLKMNMVAIYGGEPYEKQQAKLESGADIIIGTTGRIIDFYKQGLLPLKGIEVLVLDEADRMLDMGFIPDVEKIMKLLPPLRQTAMFSATMPKEVKRLTESYMMDPKKIEVAPAASAAETVTQRLVMVNGGIREKQSTLESLIKYNFPLHYSNCVTSLSCKLSLIFHILYFENKFLLK